MRLIDRLFGGAEEAPWREARGAKTETTPTPPESNEMKTYRAAVVGLGGIGTGAPPPRQPYPTLGTAWPHSHVAAYHAYPRTGVVAVCDLQEAVLEKFRAVWGEALPAVETYADHREMLQRRTWRSSASSPPTTATPRS